MEFTIRHEHYHYDGNKEILDEILKSNLDINLKLKQIMTKQEKLDASIARLEAATTEIANDLAALREEIKDTISEESLTKLDANIATLEEMGKDPENPVPEGEEKPE